MYVHRFLTGMTSAATCCNYVHPFLTSTTSVTTCCTYTTSTQARHVPRPAGRTPLPHKYHKCHDLLGACPSGDFCQRIIGFNIIFHLFVEANNSRSTLTQNIRWTQYTRFRKVCTANPIQYHISDCLTHAYFCWRQQFPLNFDLKH